MILVKGKEAYSVTIILHYSFSKASSNRKLKTDISLQTNNKNTTTKMRLLKNFIKYHSDIEYIQLRDSYFRHIN